jgi:hypothetical protein
VSSSSLIFLPRGSVISHDFENELLRNKVNYVVTTSNSPIFSTLNECNIGIYAGPQKLVKATRNPFNSGEFFDGYIFSIEPQKFIECVNDYLK